MRSLPVQCGTVQIASVAGELKQISVSGLAKARLLWLFRNFYILDFPVLSKKQQQLIARVWHEGANADSVDASPDLIGTIEGFSPQLYQPSVSTARAARHGARFGLSRGLRTPAFWTAMGVLLLGGAIGLGLKHGTNPRPRVNAAAATKSHVAAVAPSNNVKATVHLLDRTTAKSAPPVAELSAAAAEASSVPEHHLPDAMAGNASSLNGSPPQPQLKVSTKATERPEVMIRVSVDSEGQAQEFHVLRGDQQKRSAALNAARHWSFQPCSGSAGCEHLLKFTDYGDASILRLID